MFGDFTLDIERKMLWRGKEHVSVGHRAFAILVSLLENPGRLVSKSELFERAWPGISVDAANLRVQIGNIRRMLGPLGREIVTEQSLGYSFQGEVRASTASGAAKFAQRFFAPDNLVRPIGREVEIAQLDAALSAHRLVSIVGPGGIGKTTLALELARRLDGHYLDGVCFVDLSMAAQPQDVITTVAAALQRPVQSDASADVLTCLRTRRLLMVLDCCERVIEPVAALAATILAQAPGVSIVATSREALRLAGECVTQVSGLDVPPRDVTLDTAPRFGAMSLFLRTATAAGSGLSLHRGNLAVMTEICRRLDGIPLAIDLAASLAGTLGLEAIRQGLDECMSTLSLGRRGGIPRHRTLEATIAWSYDLLNPLEALALQRLSIFAASFSLEDACQVIAYGPLDARAARLAIITLSQKSLLTGRTDREPAEYRLLETTRNFAADRLVDAADRRQLAKSHAIFLLGRLKDLEPTILTLAGGTGPAPHLVKDVRQALEWAWSSQAEADTQADLAIDLTLAGESLWLTLGLYNEHAGWALRADESGQAGPAREAAVVTARAYGAIYDAARHDGILVVDRALDLARRSGDDFLVMRNLFHGCYYNLIRHRGHESLDLAEQYHAVALANGHETLIAFAKVGAAIAQIQIGQWDEAIACFEATLAAPPPELPDGITLRLGMDAVSLALFELGGLAWVRGMVKRGTALIDQALARAELLGSPQNRFQALCFGGCSTAVLCHDVERLRFYLGLLEDHAREFSLWAIMANAYRGCLAWLEGRFAEARDLLEAYFATGVPSASLDITFLTILADMRLKLGDVEGAETAIMDAWARRCSDHDPFIAAQFPRVQADLTLVKHGKDSLHIAQAADLYRQSIAMARGNGTLAFEIPAMLALARLDLAQERTAQALAALRSTVKLAPADEDLPLMREVRHLIERIENPPQP